MGSFKVRHCTYIIYVQRTCQCLFFLEIDIHIYRLGRFNNPTFSTPLPQTHTSDRPIFKISYDSENLGKLTRDSVAISLIFALEDPLNCYHIFWV